MNSDLNSEDSATGYICQRKLTILQLLPSLHSGGVERGTIEIASALSTAGHTAIVASEGGPLETQLSHAKAIHIKLPLASKNPFIILQNAFILCQIIKKYRVDIIHARSRAPAWSAYIAAKRTGCKFITTFHGIYRMNFPLKKWYNSIMTRGAKIIAVSNYVASHISENYNIDPSYVKVIHRGVDPVYFDPENVAERRIIELSQKMYLPTDKTLIILPARLTRWKGHEFVLEALKLVRNKNYFCLFIGDDKHHLGYRESLQVKIKKYMLSENVVIASNVSDMPALYALADLVLAPSIEPEAFGRVIAEAGSMGKFVITTNIGGARETVKHKITGILVEPWDIRALAAAIEEFMQYDNETRINIGKTAREHINSNFSLAQMCSKTLKIYEEL